MREFKILAATGALGYGLSEELFREAMKRKPDMVGADGGSNDGGPYYLGHGASHCDDRSIERELRIILPCVRDAGIPFLIGSASTAGGEPHIEKTLKIIKGICKEIGWSAKTAVIHAEIPAEYMHEKFDLGKIEALDCAPELTKKDIDECVRIVGQMGTEPFIRALDTGADIIVAGRACDTAVFAALPIKLGFDPALCFHAAKIVECGAYCCSPGGGADPMWVTIREKDFILETLNDARKVLPLSVAAHSLYEQGHPSKFYEPDGMTDCSTAKFEAYNGSDKAVIVSGSKFVGAEDGKYTLKIEGAAREGYRCACIAGIRDVYMIKNIDSVLENVNAHIKSNTDKDDYKIKYRIFGKNAVMGDLEYEPCTAKEIGVLTDVLAETQERANTICAMARSGILHTPYPERRSTGGNVAMAFSPHDIPVGPVYRFGIYHIIKDLSNKDFEKLFPVEIVEVKI